MKLVNISDADYAKALEYFGLETYPKQDAGEWVKIHDMKTEGNLTSFTGGTAPHILALSGLLLQGKVKDYHFNDTSIQILVTAPNENFILSNTKKNLYIYTAYKVKENGVTSTELESADYQIENANTRIILNEDSKSDFEKRCEWYETKLQEIKDWESNYLATTNQMKNNKWFGIIKKMNSQGIKHTYFTTNQSLVRRLNHGEGRWTSFQYDLLCQPAYYREFFREHPLFNFKKEIINASGEKIKAWKPIGGVKTTTGDIGLVKTTKTYEVVSIIPKLWHINCKVVTNEGSDFYVRCYGLEPFSINIKEYITNELGETIMSVENGSIKHTYTDIYPETMFNYGYNETTGVISSEISPAFYYDSTFSYEKVKANCTPLEWCKISSFYVTAFDNTMSGAHSLDKGITNTTAGDFEARGKNFGSQMQGHSAKWSIPDWHLMECLHGLIHIIKVDNSLVSHPLHRVRRSGMIGGLSLELPESETMGYYLNQSSGVETIMSAKALGMEFVDCPRVYCYQKKGGSHIIIGSEYVSGCLAWGSGAGWDDASRLQLMNNPT